MKSNKVLFTVLILTFVMAAGMFYYQNFYSKSTQGQESKVVYVAKRDVVQGETFSKDNVGAIQIPVTSMLDSYELSLEEDILGKKAQTDIHEHEILIKERIESKERDLKEFVVFVKSDSDLRNIKEGSQVRVGVIPTEYESKELYMVLDKKTVVGVDIKMNSRGESTGIVDSVRVLMGEKEAELYHEASKSGSIVVLEYTTLAEAEKAEMQRFDTFLDELPVEEEE